MNSSYQQKKSSSLQADLVHIRKSIKLLHNKIKQELHDVPSQEAYKIPETSYKTFAFIQNTLDEAEENTKHIPLYQNLDELKLDASTLKELQDLHFSVEQMENELQDIIRVMRHKLYTESKTVYNFLKKPKEVA